MYATIDLPRLAEALDANDAQRLFLDLDSSQLIFQPAGSPPPGSDDKLEVRPERYLAVPRLDGEERLALRQAFADSLGGGSRVLLDSALQSRRPLRSFDYELAQQPALAERWQQYRHERLLRLASEWLAEQGLEPVPRRRG